MTKGYLMGTSVVLQLVVVSRLPVVYGQGVVPWPGERNGMAEVDVPKCGQS
jgi:hypothetical protein